MVDSFSSIPENFSSKVDVIIVGAGLSGLVSAVKMLQKERTLQVKILEASNRVGGQLEETALGELGSKWFTAEQYHIFQLLEQWQIPAHKRVVLAPHMRRCWDLDHGLFATFAKYELTRYIRELDLRVKFYKPGRYNPCARSKSMQKHIRNRLFFNKSRKFMENLVLLITGVSACNIEYTEFMSICYTCGGLQTFIDLFYECPKSLLEISTNELLDVLLGHLDYSNILLWRTVSEVQQFSDYVQVRDSEYQIHTADVVILAIPWDKIEHIYLSPPLPKEFRMFAPRRDQHQTIITSFIARFHEGHWRTFGYSGNFLCNTPLILGHEYRPTTYSGFMVHDIDIEPLVRSIVLKMLSQHFGDRMLFPLEYYQRSYTLNPKLNVPLTTPWRRIVWSSSSVAATSYRGCIGGAVQSGLRAAMNALLIIRPQAVSWQDITEIQRYDSLVKRQTSWLKLYMSTWNLYNCSYYTLMTCSAVVLVGVLYKKLNLLRVDFTHTPNFMK